MDHIVGFTGSRKNPTREQRNWFVDMISEIIDIRPITEFHHGDCVGSDAFAHKIIAALQIPIIIHPPILGIYRAYMDGPMVTILEPKPYLERNRDIVDASDRMVALPSGPEELRSGTWSTIRYARETSAAINIGPYRKATK